MSMRAHAHWSGESFEIIPYHVLTAGPIRGAQRFQRVVLDTSVLVDLERLYRGGLGHLERHGRGETAMRVRWFLANLHNLGDIAPVFAAVESSWRAGRLDMDRYRITAGIVTDLTQASDEKLRATFDGDPIDLEDHDVDVNVEGFSAVLWQRLLPGYVVLREAWWAAATLKGVDRQLNHVHELVAEQMRFLPGW